MAMEEKGKGKGKGKGLVRPMTMDRAPVNRLTREFFGLQKLSVDSLLVSRLSRRPLPMTTSYRHDRDRFFSYSFIYLALLYRRRSDSRNCGQGRSAGGRSTNARTLTAAQIVESM